MPTTTTWTRKAEKAWDDLHAKVTEDAYGDFGTFLAPFVDEAVVLGLAPDARASASIVEHHLSPVIGWLRLTVAGKGVYGVEDCRRSWLERVSRCVADFEARRFAGGSVAR